MGQQASPLQRRDCGVPRQTAGSYTRTSPRAAKQIEMKKRKAASVNPRPERKQARMEKIIRKTPQPTKCLTQSPWNFPMLKSAINAARIGRLDPEFAKQVYEWAREDGIDLETFEYFPAPEPMPRRSRRGRHAA